MTRVTIQRADDGYFQINGSTTPFSVVRDAINFARCTFDDAAIRVRAIDIGPAAARKARWIKIDR